VTIEQAFLARLVAGLDDAGIPYMVAGSLGSSLLGQYRTTNDADVVIAPTPEQLERMLSALGDDYYVDAETARKALEDRSMFNVIDFQTGSKADLIVRKDRPFSIEEFNRRRRATILGTSVWTVTPEDAILSKLEWAKVGESERQLQDALGVAVVQMPQLDWDYLRRWAVELGVEDLLNRMITEIDAVKRPDPK
jgi:predicted nucleotidyltransferase